MNDHDEKLISILNREKESGNDVISLQMNEETFMKLSDDHVTCDKCSRFYCSAKYKDIPIILNQNEINNIIVLSIKKTFEL